MNEMVFAEFTDTEGARHIIRLNAVSRVDVAGTPEAPEVEAWVQFGGTFRLAGEEARWLRVIDDGPQVVCYPKVDTPR